MIDFIYNQHSHRLRSFNQAWLSPANLQTFADVVRGAGSPYTNCWGFVDGQSGQSGTLQRTLYNGHKRVHAIKLQSVVTPNERIANLFGPVEGGVITVACYPILDCCHSYSFTLALPSAIIYASMVTTIQRITPYSTTAAI